MVHDRTAALRTQCVPIRILIDSHAISVYSQQSSRHNKSSILRRKHFDDDCKDYSPSTSLSPVSVHSDDDFKDFKDCSPSQKSLGHEDYNYRITDSDKPIAKVLHQRGYAKLRKLTSTAQGSVWRARMSGVRSTSSQSQSVVIKVASKLYYKSTESSKNMENILREIDLIRQINRKQRGSESQVVRQSIIQVLDTIDTEDYHMMVVEDGGTDLLAFIRSVHEEVAKGTMAVCEWQKTVRLMAKRLSKVLHWLHSEMALCHLDISLENVLISNVKWVWYPDQNKRMRKRLAPSFELKLIDFGVAQVFDTESSSVFECSSVLGKETYCSPQIMALQSKLVEKAYDARKADVWSLGVCLFTMAIGCPPWNKATSKDRLYEWIVMDQDLDMVLGKWNRSHYMSKAMKDLLQRMFTEDEADRISTAEMTNHSWFD